MVCEDRVDCRVDAKLVRDHSCAVRVVDEELCAPTIVEVSTQDIRSTIRDAHNRAEELQGQTVRPCFPKKERIESDSSFVLHEILQDNADDLLLAFGKVEAIEAVADRQIAALQVSCETSQIPIQSQFSIDQQNRNSPVRLSFSFNSICCRMPVPAIMLRA